MGVALHSAKHITKDSLSLLTHGYRIVCIEYPISTATSLVRLHSLEKGCKNTSSTPPLNRSHDSAAFSPSPANDVFVLPCCHTLALSYSLVLHRQIFLTWTINTLLVCTFAHHLHQTSYIAPAIVCRTIIHPTMH